MNDQRLDERDLPWPMRPWLMAAFCAAAGLLFWWLVDDGDAARGPAAAASGVAVTTVALVLTIERRRWTWAVGFALGWGAVIALIAWMAAGYGRAQTVAEWPFFSGIFAVLLAAPLFQAMRDQEDFRFPAALAHGHIWTDAVIGLVSLLFVAISWMLAWLIAGLFEMIGVRFIEELLQSGWFGWMLAGTAFGGAVGVLRERDALVATLHRLAMVVLSVLAPVLAVALILFLGTLPLAGLGGLWDGWASAAALTLSAGAGSLVLANAALGPAAAEGAPHPAFRWAALALSLVILPLAILAALAMGLRIDQYGWTPERIWGVLAAGVAIAIGLAGWWAVARDRLRFAARWQQAQVTIGMIVCGVTLFLALPIVDFGAIATRDQLARLHSGAVNAERFDWRALAFDFGPSGRAALNAMARDTSQPALRRQAILVLRADDRFDIEEAQREPTDLAAIRRNLTIVPEGRQLPDGVMAHIADTRLCSVRRCLVRWLDDGQVLVVGRRGINMQINAVVISPTTDAVWALRGLTGERATLPDGVDETALDPAAGNVVLEPVQRQQVIVGGRVLGEIPVTE